VERAATVKLQCGSFFLSASVSLDASPQSTQSPYLEAVMPLRDDDEPLPPHWCLAIAFSVSFAMWGVLILLFRWLWSMVR
jgi:hypothetical protein